MTINVYSEIGPLRKVLLHRPGAELENLVPQYLPDMLFDDIPALSVAQTEHDAFAAALTEQGVEVIYLEQLAAQVLEDEDIRRCFIAEFIREAGVHSRYDYEILMDYLKQLDSPLELVERLMSGVRKAELPQSRGVSLSDYITDYYPFALAPLPNLYFTRDSFACVGNGVSLHRMSSAIRHREVIFGRYIFKYHPDFCSAPHWFDSDSHFSLEGGDILVLSSRVVAIGVSQRTSPQAVEEFAHTILKADNSFESILVVDLPKVRAFMHLDTILTMVDVDKFLIHPNVKGEIHCFNITLAPGGDIAIRECRDRLDRVLAQAMEIDRVQLISCGGDQPIDSAREQWNDGANSLAVAPGKVVVYARNDRTNHILQENGVTVIPIASSELSRGRGGPRCMSMPLWRDRN